MCVKYTKLPRNYEAACRVCVPSVIQALHSFLKLLTIIDLLMIVELPEICADLRHVPYTLLRMYFL